MCFELCNRVSGPLHIREFDCFLRIEAKKLGGVSLLFKLKLNELHFCKHYCQIFIMDSLFVKKDKS